MRSIDFAAIVVLGLALLGAAGQAPEKSPPKAPASAPTSAPAASMPAHDGSLRWHFERGKCFNYDVKQTITIKSSDPSKQQKDPLDVDGTIEIRAAAADKAQLRFKAERMMTPPSHASAPAPAPEPETGTCSCRRVKSPEAPSGSKPPVPPPAIPAKMIAKFDLSPDGELVGPPMGSGGQTELMLRLLLPLPHQPLELGKTETSDLDIVAAGARFPLAGKRVLTYKEDKEVDGRRCAVLVMQAGLKPDPAAERRREGSIEIKAETTALFDLEAGRFLRSSSHTWLQINSVRDVGGHKKGINVEQEQQTTLTLRPAK